MLEEHKSVTKMQLSPTVHLDSGPQTTLCMGSGMLQFMWIIMNTHDKRTSDETKQGGSPLKLEITTDQYW